ncbi:hypothetical protein LCGC14_0294630 [marine sediment metagenome]|uniref:Uncharacterized protein n=1 Tax=marine sediment metagenome TaxID=412755 RepID=A0A0F9TS19_9ZZZZ
MDYLDLRDLAQELYDLVDMKNTDALSEEDAARLEMLLDLQGQLPTETLSEYAENESTMLPEYRFTDYAQELAGEKGYTTRDSHNPLDDYIDWDGWADDLKHDYTEVTFNGEPYFIRAY